MFTHKPIEIPELETKTVDRKRFYLTPEGKMYPSITTVLQKNKMKGLMEWRPVSYTHLTLPTTMLV